MITKTESKELNDLTTKVLVEDLKLKENPRFQAFLTDLFVNTTNFGVQIKDSTFRSPLLERFAAILLQLNEPAFYLNSQSMAGMQLGELTLSLSLHDDNAHMLQLIHDPEFNLILNTLAMAKNHNYFGNVDHYMKEFASILIEDKNIPTHVVNNLQRVLNVEIALPKQRDSRLPAEERSKQIPDKLIAQPDFPYIPAAMKLQKIDEYQALISALQRSREIRALLQNQGASMMMFGEFFDILKEADKESSDMGMSFENHHVFSRLNKTHVALNNKMEQIFFEQYNIKGITIDNIEDVYNTRVTGLGDMMQTRDYLISKGMSASFADYLARRYINKVERDS